MKLSLAISYDVDDADDEKVEIAEEIIQREVTDFVVHLRRTLEDHGMVITDFAARADEPESSPPQIEP